MRPPTVQLLESQPGNAVLSPALWLLLAAAALAHQADFDVCWCKGSVSDRIFLPLVDRIRNAGGKVQVS